MTGNSKPGDAAADAALDKFAKNDDALDHDITRLEIRAEMKSFGEEENSEVIDQRALEAQRKKSDPPYAQYAILMLKNIDGWPKALFGLGLLLLLGFIAWLKWR